MLRALLAATALAVASPGLAQTVATLTVTSPAIKAGETIPAEYTADGRNVSPPLQWTGAPATTKEFAIVCDDPDVPMPQPFVHWVIYKIPGTANGVPENLPIDPATPMPAEITGALQGPSGFRRPIYRGPAPPPGKPHHYHFRVYAIDAVLDLKPGLNKAELVEAIKGHVVAEGELVAIYERKPPAWP
jgi:Raf kinase inhibitor-like YbhB/YbcL family protein